tara:strand:+ start:128 stop:577 length:450 start_codon:yes stop_codon:yes gene_type:complete
MNVFTKKENLKWLIITLVYVIFYGVLEAKFQFFTNMARADIFCICYALWGLLGLICLEAIVFKSKEKLGTLSFVASLLGLLGTFLGLANAFNSIDIDSLDPSNIEGVRDTMANLFGFMYVAMYTTITGIFVSIPALTYLHFLGETRESS